jgi:HK97 family phage major capsid protein
MKLLALKNTLADEHRAALAKAQEHMQAAEKDERVLTADERKEVDAAFAKAEEIKLKIDALQGDADLRAKLAQFQAQQDSLSATPVAQPGDGRKRILSIGQQFVQSALYLESIKGRSRPFGWRSGEAEFDGAGLRAATLTSDAASGGDLIVPDYRAGITPILFQRLTVADLLAPGTTESNLVTYMKETTATNAAATVAEGAAKPESTLIFDAVNDPVRKIATWLPVTDEMLDDVPQIRSYIDGRLRLFVEMQEEAQLLNGDGTGTNIVGLRNRAGLRTDIVRDTPDLTPNENNMDAIYRQIVAIMVNSFLMPDGIIIHPTNWQAIALAKNADGDYLGAGPFNSAQQFRLWGLPVVVTTAITAGVGLVGAFRASAQVFRKGGISLETSNSHSDFFTKNLTAIRAEERLALAVYRPGAIGEVTNLE